MKRLLPIVLLSVLCVKSSLAQRPDANAGQQVFVPRERRTPAQIKADKLAHQPFAAEFISVDGPGRFVRPTTSRPRVLNQFAIPVYLYFVDWPFEVIGRVVVHATPLDRS